MPWPATPAGLSSGGALGSLTAAWREQATATLTGPAGGPVSGAGLISQYQALSLRNYDIKKWKNSFHLKKIPVLSSKKYNSHLFRCLKAGMKPELVDAAFRRKSPHKKVGNISSDEPFLIDNFNPLGQDDISDILMVRITLRKTVLLFPLCRIYPAVSRRP